MYARRELIRKPEQLPVRQTSLSYIYGRLVRLQLNAFPDMVPDIQMVISLISHMH